MIPVDHRRIGGLLAIAASSAVVSMAAGQATSGAGGGNDNNYNNRPVLTPGPSYNNRPVYAPPQPVRSQAPARMSGLGGVKSQPGVRSAAPNRIPITTFGQPISSTPGSVGPAITPPTTTPRIIDSGGFVRGVIPVPVVGDGLKISGTYQDGPFKLAFTAGGLGRVFLPRDGVIVPIYSGGYGAVLPYGGIGNYFGSDTIFSSSYGPMRAQPAVETKPVDDVQNAPAPLILTMDERAAQRLKSGDAAGAVASYQAILKQRPTDGDAMRLMGLSLIDSGRLSDGIAVIALAYKTDSTLPERPLNPEVFKDGAARLRQHLNRVSAIANKEKSGTAWFVLATLMQAEGRNKQAAAMVDRARGAGMDSQIADELAGALSSVK